MLQVSFPLDLSPPTSRFSLTYLIERKKERKCSHCNDNSGGNSNKKTGLKLASVPHCLTLHSFSVKKNGPSIANLSTELKDPSLISPGVRLQGKLLPLSSSEYLFFLSLKVCSFPFLSYILTSSFFTLLNIKTSL